MLINVHDAKVGTITWEMSDEARSVLSVLPEETSREASDYLGYLLFGYAALIDLATVMGTQREAAFELIESNMSQLTEELSNLIGISSSQH